MRLTTPQPELAAAAKWAARQLPSKTVSPVMLGMRLHAADDTLTVSVWDGTTAAHATLTADIEDPGTAVVPGQLFASVLENLRKSEVTIADGTELTVSTFGAEFTLPALDAATYPVLPDTAATVGHVDGTEFAAAYIRVKDAISKDATGTFAGMSGVRLTIADDTLTLTATDRYRIATATLPWHGEPITAMGVLPGKALADNARAVSGPLHLALPADGSGTATLAGDGRQITTMLIDPELFPHKVDKATPARFSGHLSVDAAELTDAVRAAMSVTQNGRPVWITASRDRVTVKAGLDARSVVEVDGTYAGDDDEFEAAINSGYLLDGLGPLTGQIQIDFSTPITPAVIHHLDDDTYRYLVIPIRDPHKAT